MIRRLYWLGNAIVQWLDQGGWQARKRACRERIATQFSLDAMASAYREVWADAAGSVRESST